MPNPQPKSKLKDPSAEEPNDDWTFIDHCILAKSKGDDDKKAADLLRPMSQNVKQFALAHKMAITRGHIATALKLAAHMKDQWEEDHGHPTGTYHCPKVGTKQLTSHLSMS